jgi:hypothetical protein
MSALPEIWRHFLAASACIRPALRPGAIIMMVRRQQATWIEVVGDDFAAAPIADNENGLAQ